MIILSMIDANDFVETAILDTATYQLHFGWNDYSKSWSLDVRNDGGIDIVRGISIAPNFPLLHQYRRHAGLPPGELVATIANSNVTVLTRDSFMDGSCAFIYIPGDELNVIVESAV